ncbi:MAG: DUF2235 domain-containing protein, partial [Pseudomonadota bacterium]
MTHVIILDGTMSSLADGHETNAGQAFKLLQEAPTEERLDLRYEAGIQWTDWRSTRDVIEGRGLSRQIRRVYGTLASRYRPGDRIFLFGFSRGAYAVRSLAGAIDRVGLVKAEHATVRNIRQAYRHYEETPDSVAAKEFGATYCHEAVPIEMIGVWDTVKALGFKFPGLTGLFARSHEFHNHALGAGVKAGYHALALHEMRQAFRPVLWDTTGFRGHVEQVWFRGTHGDVGGHLTGYTPARPLSNIPFVWMMQKAQANGLPLPEGWQDRFDTDPDAPSVGGFRGWGKIFWDRRRRKPGKDPSESLHPSAQRRALSTILRQV